MSFWTKLKHFLTIRWKIVDVPGNPTVDYRYRNHKPGYIEGVTYQGDDWDGIRLDDKNGTPVANVYDLEHTGRYKGLGIARWHGEFLRSQTNPEEDELYNVRIIKEIN